MLINKLMGSIGDLNNAEDDDDEEDNLHMNTVFAGKSRRNSLSGSLTSELQRRRSSLTV
jgi:hypothetical protein